MSTDKENFYKRKKRILGLMKQSTVSRDYIEYLQELLKMERESYEDNEATEYARGRVTMLKTLLEELGVSK